MRHEAAIIIGSIEAIVIGVVNVVAFVLELDPELVVLINAVMIPTIVLLGALLTRANVFSQASRDADVDVAAIRDG